MANSITVNVRGSELQALYERRASAASAKIIRIQAKAEKVKREVEAERGSLDEQIADLGGVISHGRHMHGHSHGHVHASHAAYMAETLPAALREVQAELDYFKFMGEHIQAGTTYSVPSDEVARLFGLGAVHYGPPTIGLDD
jgi:hypothetical protein